MFGKKAPSTALAPRPEAGMTAWNPWEELAEMRRQMDNMLARPFGYTPLAQLIPGGNFNYEPPVDIYTTDDKVTVYATLPGFPLEAINVEAEPDVITIQGERKALYDADKAVPEQQTGALEERRFRIQFTLPAEVDPNQVKATFKDGILQLEMPKAVPAKTNTVKVEVKAV